MPGPAGINEYFKLKLSRPGSLIRSSFIEGPNPGPWTGYHFIYEGIATSQTMDSIRRSTGYDNCLAVDRVGHNGRIVVLWKNSLNCFGTSYLRNQLDMDIQENRVGELAPYWVLWVC